MENQTSSKQITLFEKATAVVSLSVFSGDVYITQ